MECLRGEFVEGRILDGRFETIRPLNQGSFGQVFLAKDLETNEDVAIKCLTKISPDASNAPTCDGRFEELECHKRFGRHPNLVNLIHHFETDAHMFLVLEFCANGDLYEAIRVNRGPLETEHVREFMLQLVDALDFIHSKGLYHRDIKPENIFLTQDGSMKLGDFGLATRESWCYEACVGSDRYMAPEQYEPGTTGYSPAKADIWSVGICLLNILFARNPFVSPTESDKLFSDFVRDRQSLFDIFPNMSQDTFEILTHALAFDPKKRSLACVRDSIMRAISFTTDDETLDDFCVEDNEVVTATANQPSRQQQRLLPWAKALQTSPPLAMRQLSIIPDNESYTEDLFPASEAGATSWFSTQNAPSMASLVDSAMSESLKSLHLPRQRPMLPRSDPVPITGSLPTSSIFVDGLWQNTTDQISKSWSDLWDEEESEDEDLAFQQRREQNSRSWSQESQDVTPLGLREQASASPPDRSITPVTHATAPHTAKVHSLEVDSDTGDTGTSSSAPRPIHQLSPKKSNIDKWADLGDKRRKFKTRDLFSPQRTANNWRPAARVPPQSDRRRRLFLEKDWRRHDEEVPKLSPAKPSYDTTIDDDLDLVGGWHDLHL
ncbi:hypothetical protein N7470_006145 [Penicillium chermesinum]|nr:hypothetical protein N7470_006145 [Penicillium chermesinum]